MIDRPSGTEGYADEAPALVRQYESIAFAEVHREVMVLIPPVPVRILDIGAGTGRDAAGFAAMGHAVTAVEPTAEMRYAAMALHPSPRIEWIDDSLPDLALLHARGEVFDVVMLTAVWMHLDERQRRRAMPRVAGLVRLGGVMMLSLRYGPVPPGRRMFDVSADETVQLARAEGLTLLLRRDHQHGQLGRPGVSWTRLAFSRLPATRSHPHGRAIMVRATHRGQAHMTPSINADRLWQSIMDIARDRSDTGRWVESPGAVSGGQGGARAVPVVVQAARPAFEQDAIGNMFLRRAATDAGAPAVAFGSHLDTVPTGGRFDGVFGVLAGLEVMRALTTPASGPVRRWSW